MRYGFLAVLRWALPWVMLLSIGLAPGCDDPPELSFRGGLEGRRAVLLVGSDDLRGLLPASTRGVRVQNDAELGSLFDATDGLALAAALAREGLEGVLVDAHAEAKPPGDSEAGRPESLRARFHRFAAVDGFRAVLLDVDAAFYEVHDDERFRPEVGEAMARVARMILAGNPPPPITSFPEPLRRIESAEMMVLIKHGDEPRLWRSARASSAARALTTAATTARQRWEEREAAMGGDLSFRLPTLEVEVYVVVDDGTLLSRAPSFIERVFTAEHGVAFEQRGATWKYTLPAERDPSAVESYSKLFEAHGLVKGSLGRTDLRLYRMLLKRVGVARSIR